MACTAEEKPSGTDHSVPTEAYSQNKQLGLHIIRTHDPEVTNLIALTTFVSVYEFDDVRSSWRRANVEGFLFLVQRKTTPTYRVIILNQKNQRNLIEDIDETWEITEEVNYIFFRREDSEGDLVTRGLWFHDDEERHRIRNHLKRIVCSLKSESRQGRSGTRISVAQSSASPSSAGIESMADAAGNEAGEVSELMVAALLRRIIATQ